MTIQPSVVIKAEQLSKQVKSGDETLTILSDINFSIYRAETLAISGASGSGKSTLLALLAGIDTPSGGKIWLKIQPDRSRQFSSLP
jgi:putative ABC transport system ATP-binding protein